MTDWAQHAISKIRQKQENQRLSDAKFIDHQRIKKSGAPQLWNEIKTRMRANVSALNLAGGDILVIENDQPNEITVRSTPGGGKLLNVAFDPETYRLSWASGNQVQDPWKLVVNEDGGVQFQRGMFASRSADSIATQMLSDLLEIS